MQNDHDRKLVDPEGQRWQREAEDSPGPVLKRPIRRGAFLVGNVQDNDEEGS